MAFIPPPFPVACFPLLSSPQAFPILWKPFRFLSGVAAEFYPTASGLMRCLGCGEWNRAGRRHCGRCGALLGDECGRCAAVNGYGEMFCGGCGRSLPREDGGWLLAEESGAYRAGGDALHWRQLVVLFCDLAGYTRLSEEVDGEVLRVLLGEYRELCRRMVECRGGVVARYVGDGVLAYFGYPAAHEDHARRGVMAALGIQRALGERGGGPALRARIGLAAGWVVAGEDTGRGVVGFAPSLAVRVQEAVVAGGVAVDGAMRGLVRGDFVFRSLGVLVGGGLLRPRRVYGVAGRRRRARLRARLPLIGRREERRGLLMQWRRALCGHGQAALLCGGRGLGKSRLVQELRRCADGSLCWVHRCRPDDGGRPLRPLVACGEWLRRGRGCDAVLPSLARAVGACAEAPSRRLLLRLLDAAERSGRGVLFVLEDAEYLDDASHRLLDALVPLLVRRRVMVVVSFASEFAPPWLSCGHVRLYRLRRLAHPAAVRLARSARVEKRRAPTVAALGEGVPLFVLEQGLQGRAAGRRARPPPCWLTDFFTAMLDGQGEAAATARAAAAIGVEFSAELLAAVHGGDAARLHRHLRQLTAAGLLLRRGRRYRFAHRLLHRTAWQMLTTPARTRLRRKLAAARRRGR